MKHISIFLSLTFTFSAFSNSYVSFSEVASASGYSAYEVILNGQVAETIYNNLVPLFTSEVDGWVNKGSKGIFCGHHKTKGYSCSLVVDEKGIQ